MNGSAMATKFSSIGDEVSYNDYLLIANGHSIPGPISHRANTARKPSRNISTYRMQLQYYLHEPMDGKPEGWNDYSPQANAMLDVLTALSAASEPCRSVFHVRSGHFHYEVDLARLKQRNMLSGRHRPIRHAPPRDQERAVKRHKAAAGNVADIKLEPLFGDGYGHVWEAILAGYLRTLPDSGTFIGPQRHSSIVPVRELTFQALKPKPPADWRVIIFGAAPYPRAESATGISMFDNTFTSWDDPNFGRAASMRCLIKAAAMSTYNIPKESPVSALRAYLNEHEIVSPPEWFNAMLSQGVLFLNASLTIGGPASLTPAQHRAFWKPVMARIVRTILLEKASLPSNDARNSVAFLWWGRDAENTRTALQDVFEQFDLNLPIRHVTWCNPAAQGDTFCSGCIPHLTTVNEVLRKELGQAEVNWLPTRQWLTSWSGGSPMDGTFIKNTQMLQKLHMERLQAGLDLSNNLEPVFGISLQPLVSVMSACMPFGMEEAARCALSRCEEESTYTFMSADERASILLYTGGALYSRLNGALRSENRSDLTCYFLFLRLFLSACTKLGKKPEKAQLFRGISRDVRSAYGHGKVVTWWTVSSCTSDRHVAEGFAGVDGTLFIVNSLSAVSISKLSALPDEEEFVLPPGTRLRVAKVPKAVKSQCNIVVMEEESMPRLVQ